MHEPKKHAEKQANENVLTVPKHFDGPKHATNMGTKILPETWTTGDCDPKRSLRGSRTKTVTRMTTKTLTIRQHNDDDDDRRGSCGAGGGGGGAGGGGDDDTAAAGGDDDDDD